VNPETNSPVSLERWRQRAEQVNARRRARDGGRDQPRSCTGNMLAIVGAAVAGMFLLNPGFGAFFEIGVRKLLEGDNDIGRLHHLIGQMAMHIEFGANHASIANNGACVRDQIAFAIVVAVRDHRSVHAEQHDIERHGGPDLVEDFIAQPLIGGLADKACRLRPRGRSLDQRETVGLCAATRGDERCRTQGRLRRVSARRAVKR